MNPSADQVRMVAAEAESRFKAVAVEVGASEAESRAAQWAATAIQALALTMLQQAATLVGVDVDPIPTRARLMRLYGTAIDSVFAAAANAVGGAS